MKSFQKGKINIFLITRICIQDDFSNLCFNKEKQLSAHTSLWWRLLGNLIWLEFVLTVQAFSFDATEQALCRSLLQLPTLPR